MTSLRVNPPSSFVEWAARELFLQRGSLLWPAFLIGIVLYQLRYYLPFSKTVAGGIACAAILVSMTGDFALLFDNPAVHVIALPLLAYLTVMTGLSPMPRLPGFETGDYSYGLYLYHVPFIQLLIHYFPQAWTGDRWWTLFFAGFPLALTAAVISWHLIEYPVLKLRKRFSFAINHRPADGVPAATIPPGQFLLKQNPP
jgi:peptidoglycan/LPS O-acetylase OafA/YrhL